MVIRRILPNKSHPPIVLESVQCPRSYARCGIAFAVVCVVPFRLRLALQRRRLLALSLRVVAGHNESEFPLPAASDIDNNVHLILFFLCVVR